MPKTWVTPARRTILEKHKDAYDVASEADQKRLLRTIKQELRATEEGRPLPEKLSQVNPTFPFLSLLLTGFPGGVGLVPEGGKR